MSVPEPIAIPISALVSAGASFIPSPTIRTLPCFLSSATTFSLPSGITPAITSSTPASFPTALAVLSLSPVSITTLMPIFCNSLTACGLSSLITSATAIIPNSLSPFIKNRGVLPSSESLSALLNISFEIPIIEEIYFLLPPIILLPLYSADNPLPDSALKSVTSYGFKESSSAFTIIAFASGCSLLASIEYAYFKSSFSVISNGIISVTFGSPLVIVPVLSSTAI